MGEFGPGDGTEIRAAWRDGVRAARRDGGSGRPASRGSTVILDGREVANAVTFAGADPFTYTTGLGTVAPGRHDVLVRFDWAKSPAGVRAAHVGTLRTTVAAGDDPVARYAPILYGRDLPEIAGAHENNHTDVPLLAYHTSATGVAGNRTIEYTVIWSTEYGGTNTPALMARWGRTTDIEWIYRVTVDAEGRRISDAYQAANHETLPFNGVREGDHPLLQTATSDYRIDVTALTRGFMLGSASCPVRRSCSGAGPRA